MPNEGREIPQTAETNTAFVNKMREILTSNENPQARNEMAGQFMESFFGPGWTSYESINQAMENKVFDEKELPKFFDRRSMFVQVVKDAILAEGDKSAELGDAIVQGEETTRQFLPEAFRGAESALVMGLTSNNELGGLLDDVRRTFASYDMEFPEEAKILKGETDTLLKRTLEIRPRVELSRYGSKNTVEDKVVKRMVYGYLNRANEKLAA